MKRNIECIHTYYKTQTIIMPEQETITQEGTYYR
jgi:hypothetical protein